MDTRKLTKSAENILSCFEGFVRRIEPDTEKMLAEMEKKSKHFDDKWQQTNKDIDLGARTTKHRLSL